MIGQERLAMVAKQAGLSMERVEAAIRAGRQSEDWGAVSRAMREVADAERQAQTHTESARDGALFIARE